MSVRSEPRKIERRAGGPRPISGQLAGGQSAKGVCVGVTGRRQLRPSIVNISITQEGAVKGDCSGARGARRGGRCSSGRLRGLGYGCGGGQFIGHAGNAAGGHVRCGAGEGGPDFHVRVRSAEPKGYREG